jgi:hypothetical protein
MMMAMMMAMVKQMPLQMFLQMLLNRGHLHTPQTHDEVKGLQQDSFQHSDWYARAMKAILNREKVISWH